MSEPDLILNVNEGVDTIHRSPSLESCNVDDALNRQTIDPATAEALILRGAAVRCQHCNED